jgi:hypothetical protein
MATDALKVMTHVDDMSPLEALAVNRQAVEVLYSQRWKLVIEAYEQGISFAEIGNALGLGGESAERVYLRALEWQDQLVAFRDVPKTRVVTDRYAPPAGPVF